MKQYVVVNKYFDNGTVRVQIFHRDFDKEKLEAYKHEHANCDVYVDDFDTLEEAEQFHKDCFNA